MIVGTAGHIDHGKTALVKALTGVDADRLKEEKARGITIELGFAYAEIGGGTIGFIDVPGHERFIHTMAAGASGVDFALLVVAVDDGVMPQTREHLAILDLFGVERGIVALTKADLADAGRRQAVTHDVRALLSESRLRNAPILPVSALTGEGIDELKDALARAAEETEARRADGRFRLAVDRCFTLAGAGTVVTGTVLSGKVAGGERVTVSPRGLAARVRSIHAQNRPAQEGRAGDRCALNLAGEGVSKEAIARGDMVLDPVLHAPTARLDAELTVLASERKPIGPWFPAHLHHASAEVGARIVPLADIVAPGETALVQIVLDRPIAAAALDRFILRDASAQRTIGGGRFLDLRAPARKRRSQERLAQLSAMAEADPTQALRRLVGAPPGIVDLAVFARDRALGPSRMNALAQDAGAAVVDTGNGIFAMERSELALFSRRLLATVGEFHADNPELQGIGRERLRLAIAPRMPFPLFSALLQAEARAGKILLAGSFVALAGHEARLSPEDEALYRRIVPLLSGEARFRPPRTRDIAGEFGMDEERVRLVLRLAARAGRIDEIAHDHFFLREVTAEMVAQAQAASEASEDGWFSAAAFRDRVQNGRKVAIQILDFFDRHGVTLRRGDLRRMNPHRLDLFSD
ncbi:selenocysteine-specific translation elongation factor [Consotaella salsifontis]|uniref:Selenocysteine-specific elongation factor n=1 Tax=Consotaella salsifontis TaxID=1365950 RepID=A0A1T4SMF5_9HYPH|nr:selenocysteine-specific translation elongation factor [Consotaella salsifontis]SKA29402.1 selenocysteine-specific translation elongation factor SelB [Consotaella salsifontis]